MAGISAAIARDTAPTAETSPDPVCVQSYIYMLTYIHTHIDTYIHTYYYYFYYNYYCHYYYYYCCYHYYIKMY